MDDRDAAHQAVTHRRGGSVKENKGGLEERRREDGRVKRKEEI